MTNAPSFPPGGEKQADQVEAVARAIGHATISYKETRFDKTIVRKVFITSLIEKGLDVGQFGFLFTDQIVEILARAALSASKPLVVEECAKVADRYCQPRPEAPDFELGGGAAARSIARDIRDLLQSPSEGSGG